MENKIELLPCPFCGWGAELKEIKGFKGETIGASIICNLCGASTRDFASIDVATEAWNRRSNEQD